MAPAPELTTIPTNDQYCKQMLTSLVASILVVVLLLVPLPPWIPHSTKLSFNNEDNLEEDFLRMIRRQLGIGFKEDYLPWRWMKRGR